MRRLVAGGTPLRAAVVWGGRAPRIHPTAREVFRVLASPHRRSNPELLRLSRIAGMPW
ncbi:hypothetical protein [Streptomyces sp. NPDC001809]